MNYIEHFRIPGVGMYYISHDIQWISRSCKQDKFTPWLNGCAIHPYFLSQNDARNFIYQHAQKEIADKIKHFESKLSELKGSSDELGSNDVFCLAKFLEDQKKI